jgi:hypothetical protein
MFNEFTTINIKFLQRGKIKKDIKKGDDFSPPNFIYVTNKSHQRLDIT